MKVNLEKIENNTAYLDIEVDAEQFDEAMQESYKKNAKRFSVPGFRKGKAPRTLVERYYGPEVLYEDAVEFILPKAYQKGVEEYNIEPVDQPKFDIEEIELGKPLLAKAQVVVKPEVKLSEYKGLEVEKLVHNVTNEDIERELKALQERNARLVAIEDRAAENKDIAIIDFEGKLDGEPFEGGKAENYPLELGSGSFIPGFEEQVIGMSLGETKDIEVTFPEEYHEEKLAGKPVIFTVTLKELKKKEYLPLDDDFAKDVSEYETLEELKQSIRETLEKKAKDLSEASLKGSIIRKLRENTEIDIPEVMIEGETQRLIMDFAINLQMRGLNLKSYMDAVKLTPDDLKAQFRQTAVENIESSLILEQVAKEENIDVDEKELEEKLQEYAKLGNKTLEEYKKELKPEEIAGIKDAILTDKIFDLLIENAKVTERKAENVQETDNDQEIK
ncbi:MAG TPA: trigger factor [Thermoanaerobacterales bacterium]|nr:trigger factor [Thermoanaerobacterales bacterium]